VKNDDVFPQSTQKPPRLFNLFLGGSGGLCGYTGFITRYSGSAKLKSIVPAERATYCLPSIA